jgi:hypothetical protein
MDANETLAIGTVILAAATAFLVLVTLSQLRLTRKALELDGLSRVIDEVDKVHTQRDAVLAPEFPVDPSEASLEQREQARVTINAMNRMAYLVQKGLLREELVRDLYAAVVVMTWDKVERHVRGIREKPGLQMRATSFERQAQRCRRWLWKKGFLR